MTKTFDVGRHGAPGTITVHSQGGLGNQLFIYGAGLAAARQAGVDLRVDLGQHRYRADRPSLLEELGFPATYVDCGYAPPARGLRGRVVGSTAVPHGCGMREASFAYDDAVFEQRPGACLFGYFQSWRYLVPVEEELRAIFAAVLDARLERLAPVLAAMDDPLAVVAHVRRGDYLAEGAKDYHGLAGQSYYGRAIGVVRRMGFTGPVFLFSDDLPSAVSELAPLGDVRAVADIQPGALDAVDELLLMSRAPALVTANSSFSWWAGWLGDDGTGTTRPVISPRPWFDDRATDSRDLLPAHWLTLDRRDL